MNTEILKIDPQSIDITKIRIAANIIRDGGLVAFPTETVYGLGASVLNPRSVARIFEVKNRPLDDPLIIHIAVREDIFRLCKNVPDLAVKLIIEFWPGPLTLVLEKSDIIPYIVTGGLDTVAVRMPRDPIALALIKESQTPIAAPSANLFGRPSPTVAQHVLDDLSGRIEAIIDGGKASIGVESTILDLTQKLPCILRPGGVSLEKLKEIIPDITFYKQGPILAPGMYPRHYSPRAKLILVEGEGNAQVDEVIELAQGFDSQGYSFGIIAKEENKDKYDEFNVKSLGPGDDLNSCAFNLFTVLRELDKERVDVIIAEGVKEEGLGLAIMDRLRKAGGRCSVRY